MKTSSLFDDMLNQHAILSLEKQICFLDMLDDNFGSDWRWHVDLENNNINFADYLNCGIRFLGTVSHAADTLLFSTKKLCHDDE